MTTPDNTMDIIDSRDIIARIEELEGLEQAVEDARDALADAESMLQTLKDQDEDNKTDHSRVTEAQQHLDDAYLDFGRPENDELAILCDLAEQASGYAEDWLHGTTLIRSSYFIEYAQELASDIGAIDANAHWPLMHINWEAAASDLEQDYTEVEFDGVEYLIR